MNTIHTIVVIDYNDHNFGTQRTITAPFASQDREITNAKFREILEQKLEELEFDIEEIDFKDDYEQMNYFNLGKYMSEVEHEYLDDWFEIKIVETTLG